ncbi:MAG: tetratricopeptide repeat protein [Oligoflexales bacterium]
MKSKKNKIKMDSVPSEQMSDKKSFCILFVLGFFVRIIFLWETIDHPTFYDPIIDARTYHHAAMTLAQNFVWTPSFFWQPFFYPFTLSVFYLIFGVHLLGAKIAQAFLGGLSCFLVYKISSFLLSKNQSFITALFWCFYMPAVIYEVEILGAGQAIFFFLLCLFLNTKIFLLEEKPKKYFLSLVGFVNGLSILVRPVFLPIIIVQSFFLMRKHRVGYISYVLSTVFPILALCFLSYLAIGSFSFLPKSGGLNFYLGNSKNMCETINIRPGYQWEKIQAEAERERLNHQSRNNYFIQKTFQDWKENPSVVVSNVFEKFIRFFSSRELPRNIDIYNYRQSSWLAYTGLVKVGPLGIVTGFIFSFCFYGIWLLRKKTPFSFYVFSVLYVSSLLMIFVATRYRLPVMPLFLMFSIYGFSFFINSFRSFDKKHMMCGLLNPLLFFTTQIIYPQFCEEKISYLSEMYYCLGTNADKKNEPHQAIWSYEKSLDISSNHQDSLHNLIWNYRKIGENKKASLKIENSNFHEMNEKTHSTAYLIYTSLNHDQKARKHLEAALTLNPYHEDSLNHKGEWFRRRKNFQRALDFFQKSLEINPYSSITHNNIAVVYASLYDREKAVSHFEKAVLYNPSYGEAYFNLGLTLEQLERIPEALESYRKSIQLRGPKNAQLRYDLLKNK